MWSTAEHLEEIYRAQTKQPFSIEHFSMSSSLLQMFLFIYFLKEALKM